MSKSKPPTPPTTVAYIPSFGYGPGKPRWTWHDFSHSEECYLPDEGPCWELLYKCRETGTLRRWGTWFDEELESLEEAN